MTLQKNPPVIKKYIFLYCLIVLKLFRTDSKIPTRTIPQYIRFNPTLLLYTYYFSSFYLLPDNPVYSVFINLFLVNIYDKSFQLFL